ncbi:MAG: lipopolysaccharide kinase InaA family protein, partial [Planctomycetota bacterium]|nr:lipopolysaccharide kinase InaA family protein [Planctomycetota bacterium]
MDQTRIITHAGRRWLVRPSADPLLADGWPVDQPDRLTLRKRGRRRAVYRLEAGGRGYYVKTRTGAGLLRSLRARLGFGPGRREWDALLAARDADLPVPEPVALALDARETLVTEEVPGAGRLDAYLFERYWPPGPSDPPYPGARPPELVAACRRRVVPPAGTLSPRSLAYLLADLLARLAEADLYLPDFHPGNLLLAGAPGRWRLVLVDLAEAVHPAPAEATLQHLVQLEHFFEPI